MRKFIVRAVVALLLFQAARAVDRAASIEDALADGEQRLTTLRGGADPAAYDEVEQSLSFAGRLPVVGPALLNDVHRQRAMNTYWTRNYAALLDAEPEEGDEPIDPVIQFMTANAAFRSLYQNKPERAALIRALDDIVNRYSELLKTQPGHVDTAFNYEFTARLRDAISKGGGESETTVQMQQDMHGEEGDPPEGSKPADFNVIVPMEPGERQDQLDAGEGSVIIRRG